MIRHLLTVAISALIGLAGHLSPAIATADPVDATAVVLRVVDGDTIDIRDDNRGRLRVRILGIDTPETSKPGYTVGCWGPEATQFATENMLGQRVALQPDPTQDRTDRYGRTLAYLVRADGWDYSVEAARAGTAKSYVYGGKPVTRYAQIVQAEQEAKDAGRGLWGPPCNGQTESHPRGSSSASSQPPPPVGIAGLAPPSSSNVYYENCAAARKAGVAPLRIGEPGYRIGMDGDGDGVACE
ncbi:thermonuclease family protein [Mycolicibacterium sp. XJ1819]